MRHQSLRDAGRGVALAQPVLDLGDAVAVDAAQPQVRKAVLLLRLDPTPRDLEVLGELMLGDPSLGRVARARRSGVGSAGSLGSWWRSIRPDPGRDLKALTLSVGAAGGGPPARAGQARVGVVYRGAHVALRSSCDRAIRRAGLLLSRRAALAEHEDVFVGDDLGTLAARSGAPDMHRLPERRPHDQLVVPDGRQQRDGTLPVASPSRSQSAIVWPERLRSAPSQRVSLVTSTRNPPGFRTLAQASYTSAIAAR